MEELKNNEIIEEKNIEKEIVKTETKINVKDELEKMAKQYGKKVEELEKNEDIKDYLSKASKNEQAVKLLVDNAKFVNP